MFENNALVSLIVPNYNNTEYICQFIDSVLAQSYTNWELLIIDDGSITHVCDMVEEYVRKDKRICIFKREREPKGACTCRNIGMEKAKGKYICFLDSDDLLPEYCLEVRVKEIEQETSDVSFIVFPMISFFKEPLDQRTLVLGLEFFKDDLKIFLKRYRLPFVVCTNIYRREQLIKYDFYWDENLKSLQDSDYNITALLKGVKYKYSIDKRPNYFWRTGGNNQSITKSIKQISNIKSQLLFYNKLLSLGESSKYKNDINRFGKTLLLRTLSCGYPEIPLILIDSRYTLIRVKMLRFFYLHAHIQNTWIQLFFFAVCFPICYLDEFIFRIWNRYDMRQYFLQLK